MTPERIFKRSRKRAERNERNIAGKKLAAIKRHDEMVALGRTVIVTENADGTKSYSFPPKQKVPPSIPSLAFIGARQYRQTNPRKGRSGQGPEHIAAFAENASRDLAKEFDKAMSVPAVDGEPVIDTSIPPTIGEFADRDPAQGAAIDHSIATGEGLFA